MSHTSLYHLSFDDLYQCVRPIVFKVKNRFHIQLWETSDWEQEAMICLFRLLQDKPSCLSEDSLFYACFKTKFMNYVKDVLRSQESHKRRINRLPYEEISDLGHCLSQGGLSVEDMVILEEQLECLRGQLAEQERYKVDLLVSGTPFRGRKQLLRQFQALWAAG